MNNLKFNLYGLSGLLFYYILSFPIIRSVLFGQKGRILEEFSGVLDTSDNKLAIVTKYVLYVPYLINKYFFSFFNIGDFNILVVLFFSPVVYKYFKTSKNIFNFLLLLFFFIPVPLLFLSTFNKDVILVASLYMSYFFYDKNKPYVFLIYSLFLRPYIFWVPFLIRAKNILKSILVILFFFILLVNIDFTSSIIYQVFNRRLEDTSYEAVSQVVQSVYVIDIPTLMKSLIEVVPQFLFPIIFSFTIKNIMLQIYILLIFYLYFRYRNSSSRLLFFITLFYIILDPDLGAYFRHVSSFFLFFPMALGLCDSYDQRKRN